MNTIFFRSLLSEWLKKKRTAGSWLVILGGFFIPVIFLIARIVQSEDLYESNTSTEMWDHLIMNCWQFMAIFLLPMGVILTTSLVTQNEFRNNTWKQVHTTPQHFSVVYFSKLIVILIMLAQFFILFNVGIYLAGIIPGFFFADIPFPVQPYPFWPSLQLNAQYFVCCLPIVGLQYLLSLHFRNFLLPLGAGIALLIAALIGLQWKYGYVIPYSYSGLQFLSKNQGVPPTVNIAAWSTGYFLLFIIAGYFLYTGKREKG
ncbi:MAG TPA: ABC transporter permease [Bacteroidia bacterium]|nr:ABC transporter permease [Bacteroidia bacterium]